MGGFCCPCEVHRPERVASAYSRTQADLIASLHEPNWWHGCQREVDLVDGQQRITTLAIIAAVIQYVLICLSNEVLDEHSETKLRAGKVS